MAEADGRILIDTKIQDGEFKTTLKDIQRAAERCARAVEGIAKKMGVSLENAIDAKSIEANANKAEKSLNDVAKQAQKTKKELDAANKGSSQGGGSGDRELSKLERRRQEIHEMAKSWKVAEDATEQEIAAVDGLTEAERKARAELEARVKAAKEAGTYGTPNYDKDALAAVEGTASGNSPAVDTLLAKIKELRAANEAAYSKQHAEEMLQKIHELRGETQQITGVAGLLRSAWQGAKQGCAEFGALLNRVKQNAIDAANNGFATLKNKAIEAGKSLALLPLNAITGALRSMGRAARSAFDRAKDAVIQFGKAAATAPMVAIKRLASAFTGLGSKATSTNNGIAKSFFTLLKYTVGIRSLYILTNKLRSALVEGFKNLAVYDNQTNASISAVITSLNRLKNSLAAAFAPVLNVVAPIVSTLIDMLADAITYIGMFFAALTGQSTYVKANKVATDYAASLGDTASSASDAADATNDLADATDKYLSGLDEINRYQSSDNSSSGNGSGGTGGGGSGGSSGGDLFTTETMPGYFNDLAQSIKDAWANADFTEIGAMLGEKLKNALEDIPWDEIKETAARVAKSLATLLNGFIETEDLGTTIGNTLGEGINTALVFMDTFAQEFHWDSLGKFIGDSINGLFDTVDWDLLGQTVSDNTNGIFTTIDTTITTVNWRDIGNDFATTVNKIFDPNTGVDFSLISGTLSDGIEGIFDGISSTLENINWQDIARSVEDFIGGIDWSGIASSISEAIGAGLGGLAAMLATWISDAVGSIGDYFGSEIDDAGGNVALGILNGIRDVFLNLGTWVKENIIDPFLEGFKKAFGIASPATNPDLLSAAGYVGEGVLNGIANAFTNIATWVKEHILQPIIDAVTGAPAALAEAGANMWDSIKSGFSSAADKVSVTVSAVKDAAFDTVSTAWNAIKDKAAELKATAKEAVSGALSKLKDGWDSIKDKVSTLTGKAVNSASSVVSTLKGYWSDIKDKAATLTGKAVNSASGVVSTLKGYWSSIKDKAATLTGKAKNAASSTFSSLKSYWGNIYTKAAQITAKAVNKSPKVLKSIQNAWSGLKSKTVTLTANIKKNLLGAWGKLKGLLGLSTGGIYVGGRWQPIQGYASGGSPQSARLFYANENGMPELVGRIGSNTAVMNNGQIVASVAAGVYKAVVAAMSSLAGYFAQMTFALNNLPSALMEIATAIPNINVAPPVMASGTVLPPQVLIDRSDIAELRKIVNDFKDALDSFTLSTANGGNKSATATQNTRLTIQLDNRVLFDGVIQQGRNRRAQTGKNPFELP